MKSYEFFQSHSKELPVERSGETRFNCPFCDDTGFHLYVNKAKGLYHCFKCGSAGSIRKEEVKLVDMFESKIREFHKSQEEVYKTMYSEEKLVKSLPLHTELPSPAYIYLRHRGLKPEQIRRNDIGYCNDRGSRYNEGILFKVDGGKFFVVRKMFGNPKYLNAPWPKDKSLFIPGGTSFPGNISNTLVLCEGVFDALAIQRAGYGAAAILGKQATTEQLKRIVFISKDIRILLDPDAFSYAVKLKLELCMLTDCYVKVGMLQNKDPGDSTPEEIKEALSDANLR